MNAATELTTIERAEKVLAFAETKAALATLAKQSASIVTITNTAGLQECHAARMSLKNTRVEIGKRGKEAREDATAFSKAVIAKEKELIGIIDPEESRLQALQDTWEAEREAERQAKVDAIRKRHAELQARVDAIRSLATDNAKGSSEEISAAYGKVFDTEIDDTFEEFKAGAEEAKAFALSDLTHSLQVATDREVAERKAADERKAEADRVEAQRIENAKRQAELDKQETEIAEQRKQAEADQAKRDAEAKAAQRKLDEEAAAERKRLDDEARTAQKKLDDEAAAERQRLKDEADAESRKVREECDRMIEETAERDRVATEKAIQTATLVEAAQAAVDLLTSKGFGDRTETKMLAAALARETTPKTKARKAS